MRNAIHFLRAAWCDIILVESGGKYAMIDTGMAEHADRIIAYLDRLRVTHLEWILITHFHRDHYGSLPALLEKYPVNRVYMKKFSGLVINDGAGHPADQAFNDAEIQKCEQMCALCGEVSSLTVIDASVDRVQLGDFDFRIFGNTDAIREMYEDPASPWYHEIHFGENTNSVALYALVGGTAIYLGADAQNDALPEYPRYDRQNARYAREIGRKIDLYKVPHHGCGHLFDEETLRILQPRVSLVTNWDWTWNRNFAANRDLLRAASPEGEILVTDRCGYVFTLGPDGQMTRETLDPLPTVSAVEVNPEEQANFQAARKQHLAEDGILLDDGTMPVCYACGGCRQAASGTDGNGTHLPRRFWLIREGKRIGAALVLPDDPEPGCWHILDFWVFKPLRGRGAGHFCYGALEKRCVGLGAESFLLRCEKETVIRFWRAFGFRQTEESGSFRLIPPEIFPD